jgi:acetyl esterase/lipase
VAKLDKSTRQVQASGGEDRMPKIKPVETPTERREPPAFTVEGRFDQLVSLAVDLAEERLRDKSASNQLISEIIRYGSQKEKLTREKIQMETQMLAAKADALRAQETSAQLLQEAMKAMTEYSPTRDDEEEEYDDEDEDY